ncbi:unnamed protein product [Lota lota]
MTRQRGIGPDRQHPHGGPSSASGPPPSPSPRGGHLEYQPLVMKMKTAMRWGGRRSDRKRLTGGTRTRVRTSRVSSGRSRDSLSIAPSSVQSVHLVLAGVKRFLDSHPNDVLPSMRPVSFPC